MVAMSPHDQVTAACIENEFPHWKVWTGNDQLLHACVPWDTNLYVMAETLAGLRDEIVGCLRLREFALEQLRTIGRVSPPMFPGEQHDFRVQQARKAMADTEVDDERTYTLPSGGVHIRAQDVSALCETCSAKLTELELATLPGTIASEFPQ
jgi:hypothetical protein